MTATKTHARNAPHARGQDGAPKALHVAVSGSTGLIGSALVAHLERQGHTVTRLVLHLSDLGERTVLWDPETGIAEPSALEGVDMVVHLAGENVAGGRWTAAQKARIRDSRVNGTRALLASLADLENGPRVFVCASAVGWYGDRGDAVVDEASASGPGFLADVCRRWEAEAARARDLGMRVVTLRFGVVLSSRGGALEKMLLPFRLGAGGVIGGGGQWMSWVAIDDVARAIEFACAQEDLAGPVNVVAPGAATNREFTRTLGRVLGRPTVLPMPAFAARLAFGEMADEMLLASTRAVPRRLEEAGFRFEHPELEGALRHVLGQD